MDEANGDQTREPDDPGVSVHSDTKADLAPATCRLLAAVDTADVEALRICFDTTRPHEVLDDVTDTLLEQFAAIDHRLARLAPELATLRAVARVFTPPLAPAELGSELLAAAVALLETHRLPWAELALRYWLILSSYHDEVSSTRSQLRALQRRFPQQLHASPAATAMLAALESFDGSPDTASALWEKVLEHESAADDADTWWWLQWDLALSWWLGPAGKVSTAATTLRRVRDHFTDRRGQHALLAFYGGSANLALALLLLGKPREALQELEYSVRHCPSGSEHETHLVGQMALMHAEQGNWHQMEVCLERLGTAGLDAPATRFLVVGPCRLLERSARRDLRGVLGIVSELEQHERDGTGMPDHRMGWRLYATRALLALDEVDQAATAIAEAREICAGQPLPAYDAHVCLLELACAARHVSRAQGAALPVPDDLQQRCARIVRSCGDRGDLELVVQGQGEKLGMAMLWVALAVDPDLEPLVRRVSTRNDPDVVYDAVDTATALVGDRRAQVYDSALQRFGLGDASILARQPRVSVQLFGGCRVRVDGEEVPLTAWRGRRQARLLMAHLLLANGGSLHREEVADLLWPNVPADRITVRLAPLVHTLRSVLRAEQDGSTGHRFLQSANGKLRLQLAPADSCDVLRLFEAARIARRSEQSGEIVRHAIAALEDCDGTFMAGEGFDEALEAPRGRLAELVADVAVRAAEHATSVHDHQVLASGLKRLLDDDPLREDVCRALMQLYAGTGNLSAVSRVFHTTRQALEDELGMVPSRETSRLHAALISQPGDEQRAPGVSSQDLQGVGMTSGTGNDPAAG